LFRNQKVVGDDLGGKGNGGSGKPSRTTTSVRKRPLKNSWVPHIRGEGYTLSRGVSEKEWKPGDPHRNKSFNKD